MFTVFSDEQIEDEKEESMFYRCTTTDEYTPKYINPNSKKITIPSLFCATIQWHF